MYYASDLNVLTNKCNASCQNVYVLDFDEKYTQEVLLLTQHEFTF